MTSRFFLDDHIFWLTMEYYGNCTRLPPGPAAHTFSDLTTQKYGEWGVLDGGSSNWITSCSCKKNTKKTWKHHDISKEIQFVQAGWSWSYCCWVVVFKICDPKGFGDVWGWFCWETSCWIGQFGWISAVKKTINQALTFLHLEDW